MHPYWTEFGAITLAHLLAVASPGPDFAIVIRQSLAHGRRAGVWTSIGIGTGILLHVGYTLLGLGLLLRSSPLLFSILKYVGAAYLAWIGFQALRSSGGNPAAVPAAGAVPDPARAGAPRSAWTTGFLTNALNPKATLFFVALLPVVISPQTPRLIQAGYGLWMSAATMAWFSLVAFVFTREGPRRLFLRWSRWIDRLLGVVFLGFALSLAAARLR